MEISVYARPKWLEQVRGGFDDFLKGCFDVIFSFLYIERDMLKVVGSPGNEFCGIFYESFVGLLMC